MKTLLVFLTLSLMGCTTMDTTLKTLNPNNPVKPERPIMVTYTWNV